MTKVAVLGYGTVGSGVYEVIKKNRDVISGKLGEEIEVKYQVLAFGAEGCFAIS